MEFLGQFWKILTKKLRFFGERSPLKISIHWRAKVALKKIIGSVTKMNISK